MTVKDLIAELQKCDPDRLVILQRDPEGNGYAPLAGSDDNCTWSDSKNESRRERVTPDLIASGFTEEDTKRWPDSVPAVVLWPTR